MTRTCTVCTHDERHDIDVALVSREPYRHIASRFSVSTGALQRHAKEHIPAQLALAKEAGEVSRAEDLLERITSLMRRLDAFLDRAEANNNGPEFRATAGEIRRQVELLARLRGELQEGVVFNLNLHQEWPLIKATVYRVLEPYPDARERAGMEFLKLEGGVSNGTELR